MEQAQLALRGLLSQGLFEIHRLQLVSILVVRPDGDAARPLDRHLDIDPFVEGQEHRTRVILLKVIPRVDVDAER